MMDLFDDFDRDFFRGFGRPEHVLYGKNAARMMRTDVKETDEATYRTPSAIYQNSHTQSGNKSHQTLCFCTSYC